MQIGQTPRVKAAFEAPRKATEDNQELQSLASYEGTVNTVEAEKDVDNAKEDIDAKGKEEIEELVHPRAEKKYSDDDVDEIIKKRLAREREKFRKMLDEEQHETELQKRERDLDYRERKASVIAQLEKENFPTSLAGAINCLSDETKEESYQSVTEAYKKALQEGLKVALRGSTPTAGYPVGGVNLGDAFKPKVDEIGRVIGSAGVRHAKHNPRFGGI